MAASRSHWHAADRLARLSGHLRVAAPPVQPAGESWSAGRPSQPSREWNGAASHLFADPVPERLKDEWEWARTRVDLPALEAAIEALPAARRKPRVAIVGFALESNNFAPVVGKDDFSR